MARVDDFLSGEKSDSTPITPPSMQGVAAQATDWALTQPTGGKPTTENLLSALNLKIGKKIQDAGDERDMLQQEVGIRDNLSKMSYMQNQDRMQLQKNMQNTQRKEEEGDWVDKAAEVGAYATGATEIASEFVDKLSGVDQLGQPTGEAPKGSNKLRSGALKTFKYIRDFNPVTRRGAKGRNDKRKALNDAITSMKRAQSISNKDNAQLMEYYTGNLHRLKAISNTIEGGSEFIDQMIMEMNASIDAIKKVLEDY